MSSHLSALKGRFASLAAGLALALALVGTAEAQQGAIAGQVLNAETAEPVAGAQVFIPGTNIGVLTDAEGRYRLTGVPAGQVQLRVRLIGMREVTRTVTVRAGETTTRNVELQQTALRLQEVVVTGVSEATPRVKLPFTVDEVNTDDVPVPASDPFSLLAGKAAGIQVVRGSGQPGEAASIQLRGITSVDARGRSNEPLVIIDGVVATAGDLSDLNTLDIQSIEVVKGAAASSLYGSRAANGVIQIATKSGGGLQEDEFQLTLRNEYGVGWLSGDIPLTEHHPYELNADGSAFIMSSPPSGCGAENSDYTACGGGAPLDDGAAGLGATSTFMDNVYPPCTEPEGLVQTDTPEPIQTCANSGVATFDQLDRFYDPGDQYSNYIALGGRLAETNFRASFENFRETGIVDGHFGFARRNARMNLNSPIGENLTLAAHAFYSHSRQDDLGTGGPFFSLTFMSVGADLLREDAAGELVINPDPFANEPNPIYQVRNEAEDDFRDRVMGSASLDYNFTDWLDVEATLSYDRLDFKQVNFEPIGFKDPDNRGGGPGSASRFESFERAVNGNITLAARETFLEGELTTRLRGRYLFEDNKRANTQAEGDAFALGGCPELGCLLEGFGISSGQQDERAAAWLGALSVDYQGKYIFDGLVRADGTSLFGEQERWHTYGRASLAYRPSQEGWWPLAESLPEFKVHGSWGTAGGRPAWFAKFETFGVTSGGHVELGQLGNVNLEPELVTEWEVGLDAVVYDQIAVGVTRAFSTVEKQILLVPLPASQGFSDQWRNAGEVETDTWELSVDATVLEREDASWTVSTSADVIDQVMTDLNVPAFKWGPQSQFLNKEGEEIGTFYGGKWATSCADLPDGTDCGEFAVNDDGYLVWTGGAATTDGAGPDGTLSTGDDLWGDTDVINGTLYTWGIPFDAAGEGSFTRIGNNQPDWNLNVSTNFRWKGFQLYALGSGSFGLELYTQTQQWAFRENKSGQQDVFGRPVGLKKPLGYYKQLYDVNDVNSHFVEAADYFKLRELSVSYSLPATTLADIFGGSIQEATISLIGRNLLTITDYSGYDPEVGVSGGVGGSSAVGRIDAYQFPNFPRFTGSLQLVF